MITLQMVPEPVRGWCMYGYRFPGRDEYYATINLNPFVRNYFALLEHGEPVLDIRQTSLWASVLLSPLKLFCIVRHTPRYHVFSSEEEIGMAAHHSERAHTFSIQGNTYVLRKHSHNVGSLTKNGQQIGRYIQNLKLKPWWDQSYFVDIEYLSESDEKAVLTFAFLFYGFFHANRRTLDEWLFHDKYKHLAHWEGQG